MRVVSAMNLAAAVILCSSVAALAQQPPYLAGLHIGPTAPAATAPASERNVFLHPDVQKELPRLGDRFTVLAPSSKGYNAYSYVLGVTDRWLMPEAGTPDNPFAGIDKFLAQAGYRRSPMFDVTPRPGTQKVAIYGKLQVDGDIESITHAAVQGPDGKWSCKPGGLPVIQFDDLSALRGASYGLPVAIYERSTPPAPAPMPPFPTMPVRY